VRRLAAELRPFGVADGRAAASDLELCGVYFIFAPRKTDFTDMRFKGGHSYTGPRCATARAFQTVHVHWFSGFI